jgi:hypothetical protein
MGVLATAGHGAWFGWLLPEPRWPAGGICGAVLPQSLVVPPTQALGRGGGLVAEVHRTRVGIGDLITHHGNERECR